MLKTKATPSPFAGPITLTRTEILADTTSVATVEARTLQDLANIVKGRNLERSIANGKPKQSRNSLPIDGSSVAQEYRANTYKVE